MVLIHDKVVTKVFDYRNRRVEPRNKRDHLPSMQYIPSCQQVVKQEDLAIIRYPYIEGTHLPVSCKQVIGVLKHLMKVHSDGNVHMDIRASNLVSNGDGKGCIIDFDFCSPCDTAVYPTNFRINVDDGSRHEGVQSGGNGTKEHDCFSLASVLQLCTPDNSDYNVHWGGICENIQGGELNAALENIVNYTEDYLLSSTRTISAGPGTGSPPKDCLDIEDVNLCMKEVTLQDKYL
jgi:serine/threonine protein kinase